MGASVVRFTDLRHKLNSVSPALKCWAILIVRFADWLVICF
jgi:hypothetical protein